MRRRGGDRGGGDRYLRPEEQQAAEDGQCELHDSVIVHPAEGRWTGIVILVLILVGLVGGADFGHVLFRVLVEVFFAGLAAEFHFLILVGEDKGRAHVAIELVTGDGAGGELVGRGGFGVIGTDRESGGQGESGEQEQEVQFFHMVI